MAYRVSLSVPAEDDAYAAFERIREAAPMHAEQWLVRLFMAIDTLQPESGALPGHTRSRGAWLFRPSPALRQGQGTLSHHSTSGRRSGTFASFASGMLPAMPSPPPTWRCNDA